MQGQRDLSHLGGNGALEKSRQESRPEQNGFDEVTVIQGGMSSYKAGTALYHNGGFTKPAPEYLTDYFGGRAVDFIERNKARPFLLCLTFNAVHAPLQAPASDVESHAEITHLDRRTYAGMVRALDRNVGRVLEALAASALEENTIVAFLSDNGGPAPTAPGHSRNMADNGALRGHKFDLLEGGIRTPLLLKWPRSVPRGKTFTGLTSAMDLSATFLHAADLSDAPQKPLDGGNRLPFLKGQRTGDPHDSLFWENNWFGPPDCAMRRGAWKILQLRMGPGGAVADQWELYDLSRDAGETRNVAALHPEVVRHMDSAYRAWRTGMTQSHTARMQPVR